MTETKRLVLDFEGTFMCRIATDPDPTDEALGVSGYTMALPREQRLDQVIRMQADADFKAKNQRPPLVPTPYWRGPLLDRPIGVRVTSATVDAKDYDPAHGVVGASIDLSGTDDGIFDGPIFSSRNNITGSDNTMSFVINPFQLTIDAGTAGKLSATDFADPNDHSRELWQIGDPSIYQRRLTSGFAQNDPEAMAAIGVYDLEGYMNDRVRFLKELMVAAERAKDAPGADVASLDADIEGYRTRIYQIEFWGSRVYTKLGYKCSWDFDINGPQRGRLDVGGKVLTNEPWGFKAWFGSWDGDLLIGYSRGSLSVPFQPASSAGATKRRRPAQRAV